MAMLLSKFFTASYSQINCLVEIETYPIKQAFVKVICIEYSNRFVVQFKLYPRYMEIQFVNT